MYALGMRYQDWLPWAPAQFTGGPLFNMAITVLHSVGNGYQAKQARSELSQMLPVKINPLLKGKGVQMQYPIGLPGYYQYRTLEQVLKYSEKGDTWRAFLSLLSAPIRSE
jgi:hypothetical protein